MEKAAKSRYLTATSLTARQINRSVILNIIYAQQPISRADTARETGLQRSTVSLIVDELIEDGWIVEGEYNRIPRGRRPIFLQINSEKAGLIGIYLSCDSVELAVADLNGNIQWNGQEALGDSSIETLRNALRKLSDKANNNHALEIKGVGVAFSSISDPDGKIRETIAEMFKVPVAVDSVTVACGKWFLIFHKDAKLAHEHLVSVNANTSCIDLGVIINGKPLRGAHFRAGSELSDGSVGCEADAGESGGTAVATSVKRTTKELANRLEFAVAAYDPGVILLSGPLTADSSSVLPELEQRLKSVGAGDTAIRVLDSENEQEDVYLKGAIAVILDHFLDECPTSKSIHQSTV